MSLSHRLAGLLLAATAAPLSAASFTANSSLDLPDNNPGDGVCQSDGEPVGTCTLRAAIMEANALPGSHTINLQSGRTYTLTRPGFDDTALNGDLDITKSLIIQCLDCEQRAVLDANGVSRGFDILAGDVLLSGFDITGGMDGVGGAVRIRDSAGSTTLNHMRLHGNTSSLPGGAVHNAGGNTLISASELFDNQVTGSANGTAIANFNVLIVRSSTIFANFGDSPTRSAISTAASGGLPGRLTLENSTASDNIGAGVSITSSHFTRIVNSTIAGNTWRGMTVTGTEPAMSVSNSLIARNGAGACSIIAVGGTYTGDHNLFSDNTCAAFADASLQGVDPLLTPLKRRSGGPVSVPLHWPRQDSPALSAGSAFPVGHPANCLAVDQLGIPRPQGFNGTLRCDIGAAEVPDDAIFFDSLETL